MRVARPILKPMIAVTPASGPALARSMRRWGTRKRQFGELTAFSVHGELRRELFTTLQKGMPKIAHAVDLGGIDGGDDIPILKPGLGRRLERFHLRGQGPRGRHTD